MNSSDENDKQISSYEKERQEKIERNKKILASLNPTKISPEKNTTKRKAAVTDVLPSRKSRRLLTKPKVQYSDGVVQDEDDRDLATPEKDVEYEENSGDNDIDSESFSDEIPLSKADLADLNLPPLEKNSNLSLLSELRAPTSFEEEDESHSSSDVEEEEDGIYYVQHILDKRDTSEGIEYLVQWEGFSVSESLWIPINDLGQCQDKIDQFEKGNDIPHEPRKYPVQLYTRIHNPHI